jgi:hypothetical protein
MRFILESEFYISQLERCQICEFLSIDENRLHLFDLFGFEFRTKLDFFQLRKLIAFLEKFLQKLKNYFSVHSIVSTAI